MSTATDLADNVTTQLDAHAFTLDVKPLRVWNPGLTLSELKKIGKPVLTVIPQIHRRFLIAQDTFASWIEVDVGIRDRSDSDAESDSLANLAEEVQEFFEETYIPPDDWPLAVVDLAPLFDSETLNTTKIWFSVIRLGFGVHPKMAGEQL